MAYEDNLDGRDQSGNVVENTLTAAFAETLVPGGGFGTSVAENDDLRFSRGNAVAVADHMGSALTLNGTTQYAYRADNDYHDVGEEDFAISFSVKFSDLSKNTFFISKKNSTTDGFLLYTQPGGIITLRLYNGGAVSYLMTANTTIVDKWTNITAILDRSGYFYFFIDGDYYDSADISAKDGTSLNSPGNFSVGYYDANTINGQLDQVRLFRFGKNGLYVTGTPGSNLKIQVGSSSGDVIWDDTNTSNLIKLMYQSPYESLTNLGYGGLEDADRTELLSDEGMEDNDGSWTNYNTPTTNERSSEQAHSGTYSRKLVPDTAFDGIRQNDVSVVAGDWYEVSGWIYGNGTDGVVFRIKKEGPATFHYLTSGGDAGQVVPAVWTYFSSIQQATSITTAFDVEFFAGSSTTSGSYYLDDCSLKRIGEVAHYKMNETGTPATLVDETSNGLNLTTVGSPTMSTSYLI